MAEGGEDYYSSSDDDSDDSLFDLDDDDDGADCGRTLCCCRERFQRPMQALMSCHLSLCLSLGFLVTPLVAEGESCPDSDFSLKHKYSQRMISHSLILLLKLQDLFILFLKKKKTRNFCLY